MRVCPACVHACVCVCGWGEGRKLVSLLLFSALQMVYYFLFWILPSSNGIFPILDSLLPVWCMIFYSVFLAPHVVYYFLFCTPRSLGGVLFSMVYSPLPKSFSLLYSRFPGCAFSTVYSALFRWCIFYSVFCLTHVVYFLLCILPYSGGVFSIVYSAILRWCFFCSVFCPTEVVFFLLCILPYSGGIFCCFLPYSGGVFSVVYSALLRWCIFCCVFCPTQVDAVSSCGRRPCCAVTLRAGWPALTAWTPTCAAAWASCSPSTPPTAR